VDRDSLSRRLCGLFGRYPAKILIDKIRGERKPVSAITTVAEMDEGQIGFAKNRLKIEKKRAKQTAKMTKNAGKQ
jgi:hypothetical protein